jgi:3-oxoacyl-[acyl-carrier protein] reductase
MMNLSRKTTLIVGQSRWRATLAKHFSDSGALVTSINEMHSLNDHLQSASSYDAAVLVANEPGDVSFLDSTPEAWQAALSNNFEGVVFAAQAVARHMIVHETRGRIIILSSVVGLKSYRNQSVSGTSLAALHAITRIAAVDLGAYGITINGIAAGWQVSDEELRASVPLAHNVQADDICNLCSFLASDAAAFISGAIIPLDGGYSITKAGAATVQI